MELSFTPVRSLILIILLVLFWFLDGFEFVSGAGRYIGKAWLYSVALYGIGAIMVSIVDHWVGNLDRSNLRWLYVFMGVLSIGGSLMYQHILRERVKIELGAEKER
jgi:hypothetical protein